MCDASGLSQRRTNRSDYISGRDKGEFLRTANLAIKPDTDEMYIMSSSHENGMALGKVMLRYSYHSIIFHMNLAPPLRAASCPKAFCPPLGYLEEGNIFMSNKL